MTEKDTPQGRTVNQRYYLRFSTTLGERVRGETVLNFSKSTLDLVSLQSAGSFRLICRAVAG